MSVKFTVLKALLVFLALVIVIEAAASKDMSNPYKTPLKSKIPFKSKKPVEAELTKSSPEFHLFMDERPPTSIKWNPGKRVGSGQEDVLVGNAPKKVKKYRERRPGVKSKKVRRCLENLYDEDTVDDAALSISRLEVDKKTSPIDLPVEDEIFLGSKQSRKVTPSSAQANIDLEENCESLDGVPSSSIESGLESPFSSSLSSSSSSSVSYSFPYVYGDW